MECVYVWPNFVANELKHMKILARSSTAAFDDEWKNNWF